MRTCLMREKTIRAVFRRVVTSRLSDGKYCGIVLLLKSIEISAGRQKIRVGKGDVPI